MHALILYFLQKTCKVYKFPRSDGEETVPQKIPLTFIKDGDNFELDDLNLKAYHTPG